MTAITWDQIGRKFYETGIDQGVLYLPDESGAYIDGVAWNGLMAVTEKPTGAVANAKYADNIKYLNIISTEQFEATIEAYTYPDEFARFDGLAVPIPGIAVGQQPRDRFGLCYRTKRGNDLDEDSGFKLHLVYGCIASPSQKAYTTVNDSPDGIKLSWTVTTVPVAVTGLRPTSIITVDSLEVDAGVLADLERILYGDTGVNPSLPMPDTLITMFTGSIIEVAPTQPAFNSGTNTITIPTVAGVTYYIGGVAQTAGPVVIHVDTIVQARPNAGYIFVAGVDDDWFYNFT